MDNSTLYNEKEILALLAEGDRKAYTILYTRFYPSIFRYLFVVTRSRELAEEILQDIFLKIWIKRSTLTGIRSFESYLFIMAKNRLFDVRKNVFSRPATLHEVPEFPDNDPVFEEVIMKEYLQLAQQAVEQLPEKRREIFLLNAQEELTAREIAERLGVTLTSVKKHLYEANHFIRDFLIRNGAVLIFFAAILFLIL